ncbi:MAG: ABC transporter ATP-binding protein [Gemmatimonadota bacterium]
MLSAAVVKHRGAFVLDVEVELASGATLVLAGESGAGKTTFIRLLAGLEDPDRGAINLDGEDWFGGSARSTPPHLRPIGYVAQDYALFPHRTVLDNVAFGLRAAGTREVEARLSASAMLARLGVHALGARRPAELSGGQQQRVALARALVLEPKLLLLDEPLSALDLQTRRQIRTELRKLLGELHCTTVYVTHSPLEAMLFGDQIAVVEAGRITQRGLRDDLLQHPRTPYVAEFMGVNLYQGRIVSREVGGLACVKTAGGLLRVVDPGGDEELFLAVNPREVMLSLDSPVGSAQNVMHGPIAELVPEPPFGERVRVIISTEPPLVAEVTRQAVESMALRPGRTVYAAFKATGVVTYR